MIDTNKKHEREWLPHFAELIDRLAIHQLKEVLIPEHKNKYSCEMKAIQNDLDILVEEEDIKISANLIRAIVVLAQINTHIWYNESKARRGEDQNGNLLKLTHGLNGIRSNTQNYILSLIGENGRKDWKTDCLASEFSDWSISLGNVTEDNKEKVE